MTDQDMVDQTYVEPPIVPIVEQIIGQEKPHELLLTLGGRMT